ncbi:MAG TPA: TatD family hydrolase [Geminicoccus sp.]|jgi:TatD DNase family protein|uniref:TatD family hydrolase n=1 Tax=Geminicoccus sp. TaxID=2024832 RepID=UPI002E321BC9|nr:TatD family hydrolase [Geminicoccus sp.]HEX2525925.1 TatD family hydrolase [Geminicoccus sp.]
MSLVDTHCHLDFPQLADQLPDVLARARAAGVTRMISIGTRLSAWERVHEIAKANPGVYCTIGIHPHEAGREAIGDIRPLLAVADDPLVVGIGESGFDYYYDKAPRDAQRVSFRTHVHACQESGLPLVVHTRDADDDTMDLLEAAMAEKRFSGVVHCYSSSARLAERAVTMGLHLGIGGIATFPKSEDIRATIRRMPLDALILETDAPYLAPAPHRGKTNEPAFVRHVADKLAEVLGLTVPEVERVTTANAERLFPKIKAADASMPAA